MGVEIEDMGLDAGWDAALVSADSTAYSDAANGIDSIADGATIGWDAGSGGGFDAGLRDSGGVSPADAGAGAVADAARPTEAGMPQVSDSGSALDAGAGAQRDASTAADAGRPDAGQAPVNCGPIARTGVQLCDMTADSCGAVFTNSNGCMATCSAAGLTCAMAFENVEGECKRDETRPALACDSGHESDYCLCRRP